MSEENTIIQDYTYTNETFSGCDMVATILMPVRSVNGKTIYEPYTIGELQTVTYSIHMDRKPVRSISNINAKDYVMGPRTIAGSLVFAVFNRHFAKKIMGDVKENVDNGYSFLIDEVPPFDIVLSLANEYGMRSKMVIFGVRLVNEGQVMSINDVYTENTYQFVATDVEYLDNENEYVRSKDGRNIYSIIENRMDFGGEVDFGYKVDKKNIASPAVNLNAKVMKEAQGDGLGKVMLWTTPALRSGRISLKSQSHDYTINVASEIDGNNRIYAYIEPGTYTAQYTGDIISPAITFKVLNMPSQKTEDSPAPIVEYISDNFAVIRSNGKTHTKTVYIDSDNNRFSLPLSGKRSVIENLTPSSTYTVYTANEDLSEPSCSIKIITQELGHSSYHTFKLYVFDNRKNLNNCDFAVYEKIIDCAESMYIDYGNLKTMTDSIIEANKEYRKQFNNLNTEDYKDLISYQQECDRLENLINASLELILISNDYNNDQIYGYNYENMIVKQPELIDTASGTFKIDSSISKVEVYRHIGKVYRLEKTLIKEHFIYENENAFFVFSGKPNEKYFVYAINADGYKSPRTDFFVLDDNARVKLQQKQDNENSSVQYTISHTVDDLNYLTDGVIDNIVLYSTANTPSRKTEAPPKITSVSTDSIAIAFNNNTYMKENGYKVAVSPAETSLSNSFKYKKDIAGAVEFNSREHALKAGGDYLVWIEDSSGNQISDNTPVTCMNEYSENEFFRKTFVSKLIKTARGAGIKNNIFENALNTLQCDETINKSNILENILFDCILYNIGYLNCTTDLIYLLFTVYTDMFFTPIENIFDRYISIDCGTENAVINHECIISEARITKEGMYRSEKKVAGGDIINLTANECLYDVMFLYDTGRNNISGFMLYDCINGKTRTHKINVEVM